MDATVSPVDNVPGNGGEGESRLESANECAGQDSSALFADPHRLYADTAMMKRAVRERWQVPKSKRRKLLQRMQRIVEHGEDGHAVAAFRAIVAADAVNLSGALRYNGKPQTVNLTQVNVNQTGLSDGDKAALTTAYRVLAGVPGSASEPPK
jgi:hypothetical protein